MPHQCTECGTVFEDGSTEMLSGCPECGGNTFQYHPGDPADVTEPAPDAEPPERPEPDDSVARTVGTAAQTVKNLIGSEEPATGTDPDAADPLSSWPSDNGDAGTADSDTEPSTRPETGESVTDTPRSGLRADTATESDRAEPARTAGIEDEAQASARSAVVSPEELSASAAETDTTVSSGGDNSGTASAGSVEEASKAADDRPDLSELRAELNDQFESIRIVEPGQYELNLMELYEREEYIIALQEDGRYQIQVPETWQE